METTAYNDYLGTGVLHTLQHEVTTLDGERSFIVVCQIQELHYGLIVHELRTAISRLHSDELDLALAALQRAGSHFVGLNASWTSLKWMLPSDFQAIKKGMTAVHGRSSSLQSWTFREMLHLVGLRDAELLEPVKAMAAQYEQLQQSLTAPSVYDEVLAALARAGLTVPARHEPADTVDIATASFWGALMAQQTPEPDTASGVARAIARALLGIAEGLAEYRHLHYAATLRTLGNRPAYYGMSGVDWLKPTLTQMAFPDLWAATVPDEESQA